MLAGLRKKVHAGAPKTPGVYELLDATGTVIYVGKAKDLRTRLKSYFTASWPDSKSARLIRCATDLRWRPLPSEFAALLEELRKIQSLRPRYNVTGSRYGASLAFVRMTRGAAPKLAISDSTRDAASVYYGPFRGRAHTLDAMKTLADLLGLRDCADHVPLTFADQVSLFDSPLTPHCMRVDLGNCLGPCAGRVSAERYGEAARAAVAFLEGAAAHPLDKALNAMADASDAQAYERATYWKKKFDTITWLFGAVARLRAAIEALSFVYEVKDESGGSDNRVYLVHNGIVRAEAGRPDTPLERQAFAATVERILAAEAGAPAARGGNEMTQLLLAMSWFRTHPEEYDRTSPYRRWLN